MAAISIYSFFLLSVAYVFKKYLYNFDDKAFIDTYGALTAEMRRLTNWPMTYIYAFILKRTLLAGFLVSGNVFACLFGILLLQLAYLIYIVAVRPFY